MKDARLCSTGSDCPLGTRVSVPQRQTVHWQNGCFKRCALKGERTKTEGRQRVLTFADRLSVPRGQPVTLVRHLLSSVRCHQRRGKKSVPVTPVTAQSRGWRQETVVRVFTLPIAHRCVEPDVVVRVTGSGSTNVRLPRWTASRAVAARDQVPLGLGAWRGARGRVT